MTEISLYNASVKSLDQWLGNLEHILKTAETYAEEKGYKPQALLLAQLFPDMLPLIGQVQVATGIAKACPHRIVGSTPPVYEDTEESFADLYARIAKTRAELATFTPDDINGLEAREFTVKMGPNTREFTGITYASGFTMPNVYFHITTAYNILRHNGVPLGKLDFFGGPPAP